MDKIDMIKFEGSITPDSFLDSLLDFNKLGTQTLGDLWEELVTCSRCPFKPKCDELSAKLEEQGVVPYCADLMNVMLGEKKIADIL
jgi:hypothetical protein